MKMKYLILGAGPSGLTLANRLKQMGETSFFVLEKEKEAGGPVSYTHLMNRWRHIW